MNERRVDLHFVLPDEAAVARLVAAAGFEAERLFGDYDRHDFAANRSPFMLWLLRPAAPPRLRSRGGSRPDPAGRRGQA